MIGYMIFKVRPVPNKKPGEEETLSHLLSHLRKICQRCTCTENNVFTKNV